MTLKQTPDPESYLLRWKGDELVVTLALNAPQKGRAVLRTNLGAASVRRSEIIEETERGVVPLAKAWHDIPMKDTTSPRRCGPRRFRLETDVSARWCTAEIRRSSFRSTRTRSGRAGRART